MSEQTYHGDQRHSGSPDDAPQRPAGAPQYAGGGGTEPAPHAPDAATSGTGTTRRGEPGPAEGAAYERGGNRPERKSDSGT